MISMEQLIEIKTVPIEFEYKVQHAKLEYADSTQPSYNLTRANGSFHVTHQYPRIHIDTTELRSSMNLKSVFRSTADAAEEGMQAAMEATSQIAEEGNALMNIQDGMDVATLIQNEAMDQYQSSLDSITTAIPSVPADISWDPGQLSIQYNADKLAFDWRTSDKVEKSFTPAKIDFLVKQYAHIEFKYLGKPMYIPPSASPDYKPPKMDVSA